MLYQAIPAISAVLIFTLGLIAVCAGLGLVLGGVQGLRKRYRQIDRAFNDRRREPYDDEYGSPGYR